MLHFETLVHLMTKPLSRYFQEDSKIKIFSSTFKNWVTFRIRPLPPQSWVPPLGLMQSCLAGALLSALTCPALPFSMMYSCLIIGHDGHCWTLGHSLVVLWTFDATISWDSWDLFILMWPERNKSRSSFGLHGPWCHPLPHTWISVWHWPSLFYTSLGIWRTHQAVSPLTPT